MLYRMWGMNVMLCAGERGEGLLCGDGGGCCYAPGPRHTGPKLAGHQKGAPLSSGAKPLSLLSPLFSGPNPSLSSHLSFLAPNPSLSSHLSLLAPTPPSLCLCVCFVRGLSLFSLTPCPCCASPLSLCLCMSSVRGRFSFLPHSLSLLRISPSPYVFACVL